MTTSTDPTAPEAPSSTYDQGVLREIARRVRWLSAAIVDAANAGRANHSGIKVGGHQAPSAPVLHAITCLLGDPDESYLPTLRAKGGLQLYPSRLKDPDTVDFSTGSVDISATAALWVAMAHPYVASQFPSSPPTGRFISLLPAQLSTPH